MLLVSWFEDPANLQKEGDVSTMKALILFKCVNLGKTVILHK